MAKWFQNNENSIVHFEWKIVRKYQMCKPREEENPVSRLADGWAHRKQTANREFCHFIDAKHELYCTHLLMMRAPNTQRKTHNNTSWPALLIICDDPAAGGWSIGRLPRACCQNGAKSMRFWVVRCWERAKDFIRRPFSRRFSLLWSNVVFAWRIALADVVK